MRDRVTVWTQGPMARIFPNDVPPSAKTGPYTMSAARGETECFQVGVHMEGTRLNVMTATLSELVGPGRAIIPADHIDVLYADYVPVKWPMAGQAPGDVERKAPGFYPDPLLPDWELDVAEVETPPTRSLWVRVNVPRDAAPGLYRGTLSITCRRKWFATRHEPERLLYERKVKVPFRLRVWNFALPESSSLLMTNWFFPSHVADWYQQPMWSPDYWKLIEGFAADMGAHRQNVILTPLWGGRTAEEQLIGITRRGGKYVFDFAGFDRWARIFLSRGFSWLEGHHISAGSHAAIPFWLRSGRRVQKVSFVNAQDARYEDFLRQFFASLWRHLDECGWRDNFVQHISDEPKPREVERFGRLATIVRTAAPGIRLMDALTDPELAELVDFPVPLEEQYERVRKESGVASNKIWTYYCCGPGGAWPNRFIEYLPIRVRIFSWLCFQRGIPGFLHWGYNYWAGTWKKVINPWDDPTCHRYGGGDPCVVYPPRDDRMLRKQSIVGSIRWEIVREAMEDFEYLRMVRLLADAGDRTAQGILREVTMKIVPDWTTHTRDWHKMLALRERMGELLSKQGGQGE
jgi:hypothetical protein